MWVEAWLGPGFLTMSLGCLLLWSSVLPAKQSMPFSSSLSLLFKQSYSVDQPGLTLRYLTACLCLGHAGSKGVCLCATTVITIFIRAAVTLCDPPLPLVRLGLLIIRPSLCTHLPAAVNSTQAARGLWRG